MHRAGWNEYFNAWFGPYYLAGDVELDVSFQDHHHFIDRVPIVLPDLAGRVCPYVAAESSRLPVRSDGFDVDSLCHSINVPLSLAGTQAFARTITVKQSREHPQAVQNPKKYRESVFAAQKRAAGIFTSDTWQNTAIYRPEKSFSRRIRMRLRSQV